MVTPESLRFDLSHFQKVTEEEIRRVEEIVNAQIRQDIPLMEHRDTPLEEAKKMGAIALFGEKYGDRVRVVQFGQSIEFCGGVHASSTGHIGMIKIISESSIAAGVRRIEAITGTAVENMVAELQDTISSIKAILPGNAVTASVQKLIEENNALKKQLEEFQKEKTIQLKKSLADSIKSIGDIKVISAVLPVSANVARDLAFQLRGEITEKLVVVIGSVDADKPLLTVSVSDDLTQQFNAGQLVREAAKLIQGGGGGQAHYATAGGKNKDGLQQAVDAIVAKLQ